MKICYGEWKHEKEPCETWSLRIRGGSVGKKLCFMHKINKVSPDELADKVKVKNFYEEGNKGLVIRFGHVWIFFGKGFCLENVFKTGWMDHKIL